MATGSADILSEKNEKERKFEFRFSMSYEHERRKTELEIGIPFSNVVPETKNENRSSTEFRFLIS